MNDFQRAVAAKCLRKDHEKRVMPGRIFGCSFTSKTPINAQSPHKPMWHLRKTCFGDDPYIVTTIFYTYVNLFKMAPEVGT